MVYLEMSMYSDKSITRSGIFTGDIPVAYVPIQYITLWLNSYHCIKIMSRVFLGDGETDNTGLVYSFARTDTDPKRNPINAILKPTIKTTLAFSH